MNPTWMPTFWTQDAGEWNTDAADRLIDVCSIVMRGPEAPAFALDEWQKWLLREVLATDADGNLRYRQVVISMGRQNGKSTLAAALTLFGLLMHEPAPAVAGVASNVDQAHIVYRKTLRLIEGNPALSKRFKRATETRGLHTADGLGSYKVYPSKASSIQGVTASLAVADELHVMNADVWDALVIGTGQRRNGLLVGITTAGDENSELLKRLYQRGKEDAVPGFGFYCWEAPTAAELTDETALRAANPALASGRMDMSQVLSEVVLLPEVDARRYRLNQWVPEGEPWVPPSAWSQLDRMSPDEPRTTVYLSVDRTPDWSAATVCASWRTEDNRIATDVVASMVDVSLEKLLNLILRIVRANSVHSVWLDRYALQDLASLLEQRGVRTRVLSLPDITAASSTAFNKVTTKQVIHPHHELTSFQVPRGTRKNVGEAWRIARANSAVQIDALMATVLGVYAVDVNADAPAQVF